MQPLLCYNQSYSDEYSSLIRICSADAMASSCRSVGDVRPFSIVFSVVLLIPVSCSSCFSVSPASVLAFHVNISTVLHVLSGTCGCEFTKGESKMCVLYEKVVGVTFPNDDGSSRQNYIRQLDEDESLTLESFEYEGETGFHVLDSKGHCIGNCPKDVVPVILDYYRKGYDIEVNVNNILGRDSSGEWLDGYNAGVEMEIWIYKPSYVKPSIDSQHLHSSSKNKTLTRKRCYIYAALWLFLSGGTLFPVSIYYILKARKISK